METDTNPRPNHRLTRCCGTCKFYMRKYQAARSGHCFLPDGPKLGKSIRSKEMRDRIDEFDKTHMYAYCDNHQWKPFSYLKQSAKAGGLDPDDLR